VDTTIVNPARLSPRLADDICMNCHQGGHTRVLQPGKGYLDFRPGTALYETVGVFKLALTKDRRAELDRLETLPAVRGSMLTPLWWKNSQLEMSRCFHDSNGQLRCITCHVIHNRPTEENKAAYYRERCFTCHANESCKLSLQERMKQEPANNCIGCHMPKKPVAGIPHSDDTSHRIVRRAGQPYPDYAFDEVSPDLPGLVCINRRGEDAAKAIPDLTKLLAYAEVSQNAPRLSRYYNEVLEQLRKTTPDDPSVLAALGRKAVQEKDDAKAVEYLTRALQKGANYEATYIDLGEALAHLGRVEESAKILEQGVATWPFSPEIQKALVLRYVTLKQFPQAHEAVKQYVALFPGDAFMRGVLARLEGGQP
jgi:thioredoxin-like negative regulator of GroEL